MKIVLVIWELSKFDQIRPEKKKTKKTLLGIYVCLRGMNIQLYTTGSSRGMVNQAILLL